MKTITLGGYVYFVTFIDDHSIKLWVYTLKTKYQVLGVFKHFSRFSWKRNGKEV